MKATTSPSAHTARNLITFCDRVRASVPDLDFSCRSLASDLLSLYACGALAQLETEGLHTAAECRLHAANLLEYHFRWSEEDSEARAAALFASSATPRGLVHRVLACGAEAYSQWRQAPAVFDGIGFSDLLRSRRQRLDVPMEFTMPARCF